MRLFSGSHREEKHLAFHVMLNSVVMILLVYILMQFFAYFRDNIILGISDLTALLPYVFSFIGSFVLPPALVFGIILYLSARPLQKVLTRLRAGENLNEEIREQTRRSLLGFSRLVLIMNILGFVLGYVILILAEDGFSGLFAPARLVILIANIASAIVFASAQSSLNNLSFAELRDRLDLHEIGSRKRELPRSARQVIIGVVMILYSLTYLQFNNHMLFDYQALSIEIQGDVQRGVLTESGAIQAFRERLPKVIPAVLSRPGFDYDTLPMPWASGVNHQAKEHGGFLLSALFMLLMAAVVFGSFAFDTREQLQAMQTRLRDVLKGDGDLVKRLNLRSTDEYGELAELVNGLLDQFHGIVLRIRDSVNETRAVAKSIDTVLGDAESTSENASSSVSNLAAALETQAERSRAITQTLETYQNSVKDVADAVESQRHFADETAAAMEQMSANIRSVEMMTARSGSLTGDLATKGDAGSSSVKETAQAIQSIETAAVDVLKVLGFLSKIAGDTNMLAMNAAIEAAHAGEKGAGFAVVADEVRTLASNAAAQTKSIKALVSEMTERVRLGVSSSEYSSTAFSKLADGIAEAAAISREIADAMTEQAVGTRSVEESVTQVVSATGNIRSLMDEQEKQTARMAQSLNESLSQLSALAHSSRDQARSVHDLDRSFSAVRAEVDRNLQLTEALDKELARFRL
jgi:methyl-accepting chemotaxis protein